MHDSSPQVARLPQAGRCIPEPGIARITAGTVPRGSAPLTACWRGLYEDGQDIPGQAAARDLVQSVRAHPAELPCVAHTTQSLAKDFTQVPDKYCPDCQEGEH